ncbi:hypothetical protein [Halobellus rufus]|uniref:hypothetical protein n=1 Tax=Halobellus rufus TaxID=1448860 RepID=UPI00067856F3|nr:hypothetical protein [Halobellus rufus]
MSNSHDPLDRVDRARERLPDPSPVRSTVAFLAVPLRFVAFWTAVALPFLYVPLLLGGLDGSEPTVFFALFSANVVALVVGHGYGDRSRETAQ